MSRDTPLTGMADLVLKLIKGNVLVVRDSLSVRMAYWILKLITRNVTNIKAHHREVNDNDYMQQFDNIPCFDNAGRDNLSTGMA